MIDRDKFVKTLCKDLDDLKDMPQSPKSVSIEKVILFLVDKVKEGNFRGIISVKINDNEIYTPRIDQYEIMVESTYKYLDS